MPRAVLLAVGSELLGPDRLDTNSLKTTALLERHGWAVLRKAVLGDDEAMIAAEVARAAAEAELVVVGGGLGPTADDVTREAVADATGRRLVHVREIEDELARRFAAMGRRMAPGNVQQADVIEGAEVLPNRRGTAPGQRVEIGQSVVFLFPGVPGELEWMLGEYLAPWLAARSGGRVRQTATLKIAGLPESDVDERLQPLYAELGREAITVLASPGEVRVCGTVTDEPAAVEGWLQRFRARVRELFPRELFAEREEETLESVVGALLRAAGASVATAESCTGGLVAERLTRVAGSSDYVLGGLVAYANQAKTALLGVPADLLAEHGAVSEPVARALPRGARARTGASFGLGITGVAGPGGGSAEKPVGTVHLAVAGPDGAADERHLRVRLPGDRQRVRWQASQLALEMLRRRLVDGPAEERA